MDERRDAVRDLAIGENGRRDLVLGSNVRRRKESEELRPHFDRAEEDSTGRRVAVDDAGLEPAEH